MITEAKDMQTNVRRSPPPATKAMLENAKKQLAEIKELDPEFNEKTCGNPYIIMIIKFIAEWEA